MGGLLFLFVITLFGSMILKERRAKDLFCGLRFSFFFFSFSFLFSFLFLFKQA